MTAMSMRRDKGVAQPMRKASRYTAFAEFKRKEHELQFKNYDVKASLFFLRLAVLFGGLFFAFYIVIDILHGVPPEVLSQIYLWRLLPLGYCVPFFFFAGKIKGHRALGLVTSIMEIATFFFYMAVLFIYADPEWTSKSMSVAVFVLLVFNFPNYLLHNVITSVFISAFYFVFTCLAIPNHMDTFNWYQFFGVLISIFFSYITFYQLNTLKRNNYLSQSHLQKLAETDKLTNINNRTSIDLTLQSCCLSASVNVDSFALIMFDIDKFKTVNDTYGHAVGDSVLIETVAVAIERIRKSDVIARWGGEEFVIILPQTNIDMAYKLAERIRISIMKHHFSVVGQVTASFGVTEYFQGDTAETVIERADRHMYEAKRGGRNKTVFQVAAE